MYKEHGRQPKPLMDGLVQHLTGPLAWSCEEPYDADVLAGALQAAVRLPVLDLTLEAEPTLAHD